MWVTPLLNRKTVNLAVKGFSAGDGGVSMVTVERDEPPAQVHRIRQKLHKACSCFGLCHISSVKPPMVTRGFGGKNTFWFCWMPHSWTHKKWKLRVLPSDKQYYIYAPIFCSCRTCSEGLYRFQYLQLLQNCFIDFIMFFSPSFI